MPEGQWEVVGRGNKKEKTLDNGKPKNKQDKRKVLDNIPKLEDILPPSQIKSLLAEMEADEKKNKEKKEKKEPEQKKQPKKQTEKKPDPPKPKPPKSIDAAFQNIDSNEFVNLVNSNKIRFVSAPLVWLKEIAAYINSKAALDVPDVVFSNQSVNYPMNILPVEVRKTIEAVIKEAEPSIQQLCYDGALTALANDMSRGQSSIGNKVLIQMVTNENPEVCTVSIQKSKSVWNSYQNRPPIGLSLLWSFSQGGYKNLGVGLEVWTELFSPVSDLKNYSKYTITYLSKLLDKHGKMEGSKVTLEQLLTLYDTAERNKMPKDTAGEFVKQLDKLKKIFFRSNSRFQVPFNQLMKRLPFEYLNSNKLNALHQSLLAALVECIQRDETCDATWRQLHNKCRQQSASLLRYIDTNWSEVSPKIKVKSLRSTFDFCHKASVEKNDELGVEIDRLCQEMGKKMKKAAASRRGFPWVASSLAVLAAIVGLLVYDIASASAFPKSASGKFLNDIGLLETTQAAWRKTLVVSARSYVWFENNAPVYYAKTIEFSKPYGELAKDFYLIGAEQAGKAYNNTRDYVVSTAPVVGAYIEQYAPGALETVGSYAAAGRDAVWKFTSVYYASGREFLQNKVFVGEWAPEVLQDKTLKALNSTRLVVSKYYSWFHEQVHLYSEVQ